VAQVREHLRACAHCRSSLRAYRAAPTAAAALAPALPLGRSLWERAHDVVSGWGARFGGGEPASQLAGGGAGGAGLAALAKAAAVCIGTAGAAAACVAGGIVPSPLDHSAERERPRQERRLADQPLSEVPAPKVEYAPAPAPDPTKPRPDRDRSHAAAPPAASEPVAAEPAAVSTEEAEYAPPVPEPEPAPVTSSAGGSPAGEFGP